MNEFDKTFYRIVGRHLRSLRTTNDLTLEQVAQRTGVIAKTIQRYEMGERKIDAPVLKSLVEKMGGNYEDFIASVQQEQVASLIPGAFPVNPTHKIPLLGQIAAGLPIYAEENLEGYVWTDRNHGGEYFSLRVRGDSMNAANINDGDIVIVRRQEEVEEGEIAVVLVDEEATIKRYSQDGKMVILSPQSTNPEHHAQIYSLKDHQVKILGRVVESRTEY